MATAKMTRSVRDVLARIDALLAQKRGVSALHKTQLRRKRAILDEFSGAKADRFAASTSKWIDLVVRPGEKPMRAPKDASKLTAGQADRRAKGKWFRGYTSTVTVASCSIHLAAFDIEKREKAIGGAEYLLVEGDLVVDGDVRLGRDTRSIYVVTGDLKARRIVLGDAVLVIHGNVTCERVSGSPAEGIFRVLGEVTERRRRQGGALHRSEREDGA